MGCKSDLGYLEPCRSGGCVSHARSLERGRARRPWLHPRPPSTATSEACRLEPLDERVAVGAARWQAVVLDPERETGRRERPAELRSAVGVGSGKTKVISLAVAWQYMNAVAEGLDNFAKTFLLVAPNIIVLDRLAIDFSGGRIFRTDPIIPPELAMFWDLDC